MKTRGSAAATRHIATGDILKLLTAQAAEIGPDVWAALRAQGWVSTRQDEAIAQDVADLKRAAANTTTTEEQANG